MLDIAICDDDNSFAGGLEKTLCRMEKTYGLKFEIDVYQDGCSLVKEVMSGNVMISSAWISRCGRWTGWKQPARFASWTESWN